MVLLLSRLNSFLVNLASRLVLPTPESPMRTTRRKRHLEGQFPPNKLSGCVRVRATAWARRMLIRLQLTLEEIVVLVVSAHTDGLGS